MRALVRLRCGMPALALVRHAAAITASHSHAMVAPHPTQPRRRGLAQTIRASAAADAPPGRRVDLRSDTVTMPSAEMRRVMANAPVGDDVFGEDPSVNALEAHVADLLGKEGALFVPSGTMGNIVSVGVHCGRGEELIAGQSSHIFLHEAGTASALMGIPLWPIKNAIDGTLPLDAIREAIRPDDPHYPVTRAVALENSQNQCGGAVLGLDYMRDVADLCREHDLRLHLDGARVMNAAAHLGVTAAEAVEVFDSVSLCLSKGIGAPVGSVVAGNEEFIRRARRLRKALGGGMRQAGVLAAAALHALQTNVERIGEDHALAQQLAAGIDALPGVHVRYPIDTNIVFFDVHCDEAGIGGAALCEELAARGVFIGAYNDVSVRAVTHLDVSPADIEVAIEAFADVIHGSR